jgi:hypothetical protein
MKLAAWIILVGACVLWTASARAAAAPDGLIASYDFDETDGDVARDAGPHQRHGQIRGATRVAGGRGFCLELDGDDDVDCGTLDAPNLSAMTIQAWIRPAAIPTAEAGIVGRGESLDQSFGLTYADNGGCYFYAGGGANNCLATIEPQMWHHVAATFDGTRMLLYVNGRQAAQRTLASPITIPDTGGPLFIGRNGRAHFRGMIDNVRIYDRALPLADIRAAYEAELDQVIRPMKLRPLSDPALIHDGGDFSVRTGDGNSAMEIAVGNETYRVTSTFPHLGRHVIRQRSVQVRGGRIGIEDELTNTADEPVAVLVQHRVAGTEIFRHTLLGGAELSAVARIAENPTLLLSQLNSSVGLLAEDNVLRVQFEARGANDQAEFAARHFALAGGATHKFKWSIYPFAREADSFDFVNAIRRDWNANYRIDGPFDWLEVDHPRTIALLSDPAKLKTHLARRPLKLVALLPFHAYHAGAPLSRDQYRDLMQRARRALREADPGIRCLGSIENNIVSYERAKLTAGGTLDNVCRNSGAYPLALSELQTAMLRAQIPWGDSLVINRDGRAMVEDCMPTSFVHPMVYAAPGNRHSAYLMEQAKFLIEDVGLDGIYVDHFNMAFEPQQRYDHSRWDGVTVDTDPQTGGIGARYTDAALVGIPSRDALARYVLGAGKAMVVNTPNVASELRSLPIMHLEEISSEVVPSAWKAGEAPPLIPQLARLQLSSPIAIGMPSSNRAEPHVQDVREVTKAIILYLRHGLLYYHNQTLVPESGPGGGQYGPVNHMFPITPVALAKGSIEGEERSITCVSRDFTVPGHAPPTVLLFDLNGRPVAHDIKPVRANDDAWKVDVKLKDWAEIAIVVTQGAAEP